MKNIIFILLSITNVFGVYAQGYVDQQATYALSESQNGDISNIIPVKWQRYTYITITALEQYLDSIPGSDGKERRYIVELANRVTYDNLQKGRTLFIPENFTEDYRAYSPYPFEYPPAIKLPKLFIIDKYTQTFGAYEYGRLVRWGLVSTGRRNNLTPAGRYNFNWKEYYRQSNAAPPDEVWEMYWVVNFQGRFGIHVHQYALPIDRAASHGCIRTSEADAKWNYNWANGKLIDKKGQQVRNGTPVMVINNNPVATAVHWKSENGCIVSQVHLPQSFEEINLGTADWHRGEWESGW